MTNSPAARRLAWVFCFGVAFAFVESSVVVYLRSLYYPEGFSFPLKLMGQQHLVVELAREAATIVMLAAIGVLAGSNGWGRFGFFLVGFGVWDIFYYVWLKVILDWPASVTDWDILFLLPIPWIGPVIAPALISLLMIACGSAITLRVEAKKYFYPNRWSWIFASAATGLVLFSFMMDTDATLRGQTPGSYTYSLLVISLVAYVISFAVACNPLSSHRLQADE